MSRPFLLVLAALAVLTLLSRAGILPPAIENVAWNVLMTFWWLVILVVPLLYWAAPGLFHHVDGMLGQVVSRWGHGRREAAELLARIEHMGKPHHMLQLGNLYLHQGRLRRASDWFRR